MLSGDRNQELRIMSWLIYLSGVVGLAIGIGLYQAVVSAIIVREQQEIALEIADKEQFLDRGEEIRVEHKELTARLEQLDTNAVDDAAAHSRTT